MPSVQLRLGFVMGSEDIVTPPHAFRGFQDDVFISTSQLPSERKVACFGLCLIHYSAVKFVPVCRYFDRGQARNVGQRRQVRERVGGRRDGRPTRITDGSSAEEGDDRRAKYRDEDREKCKEF